MSYTLEYFDTPGLTLYAILFNSDSEGYKPATQNFDTYTDSNIDNFDIVLTETVNRSGRYTATINSLSKGKYLYEIYQQQGGTPNKDDDFLKGVSNLFWNGSQELNSLALGRIEGVGFAGSYRLNNSGYVYIVSYDQFGQKSDMDNDPKYKVLYNSTSLGVSGSFNNLETGLYYAIIPMTSGVYNYNDDYNLFITGYIDGGSVHLIKPFDIISPDSFTLSLNVPTELGYATGIITSASSHTIMTTDLTQGNNDFFNGQILRFKTGNNASQARIISDYTGSSKTITTNKGFTNVPASGDQFMIFPIGGELNVT